MHTPLVIACVKWGRQYGPYFVNALCAMARRNLPAGAAVDFQCFTDDARGLDASITSRPLPGNLTGWWNKLHLFREGLFEPGQRVIYFDLDTLILGPLGDIAAYDGEFALLRDFYRPAGYGSGVMLWRAGTCDDLWLGFEAAGRPILAGGDQAWLERARPGADRLQDRFPGAFVSFKTDCNPLPPAGARVVCFHGEPKQDNCGADWVREIWMPGAVPPSAPAVPLPPVQAAHEREAVIVGGGPSLARTLESLRAHPSAGHDVFAAGGAAGWLKDHGISYTACVTRHTAASVPQACSTGLAALHIAHRLGYRRFHLYGFDSCYDDLAHHAYDAPDSDGDRVFTTVLYGRSFFQSQWMRAQADAFARLADEWAAQGCSLTLYGDGLLQYLAQQVNAARN